MFLGLFTSAIQALFAYLSDNFFQVRWTASESCARAPGGATPTWARARLKSLLNFKDPIEIPIEIPVEFQGPY
jgi:hypothetical protein